jgi:hypothetical protein
MDNGKLKVPLENPPSVGVGRLLPKAYNYGRQTHPPLDTNDINENGGWVCLLIHVTLFNGRPTPTWTSGNEQNSWTVCLIALVFPVTGAIRA